MSNRTGTTRQAPQKGQGQKQNKPASVGQQKQVNQTVSTPQLQAAQDAKREARMQRQAEALAAGQRRRRARQIRQYSIIAVISLVVIGIGAFMYLREANKPGEYHAMQVSQPHLEKASDAHMAYTTHPPTSGQHTKDVPAWGVYDQPVPEEGQLHALEDAGVAINYRPDLDKATVDRLKALVESYGTQIIMAPYNDLSNPIVLTAWTRMDKLDTFDEARIRRFIDAYRGIDHHKDSGS